jgi:hypothetical protein
MFDIPRMDPLMDYYLKAVDMIDRAQKLSGNSNREEVARQIFTIIKNGVFYLKDSDPDKVLNEYSKSNKKIDEEIKHIDEVKKYVEEKVPVIVKENKKSIIDPKETVVETKPLVEPIKPVGDKPGVTKNPPGPGDTIYIVQ